jgi:KDO2-lipid IV(A) lauroyltransferase
MSAGMRTLDMLARAIAWFAGSVVAVRRAHVVRSMLRAGIASCQTTADAMYLSLARGLLELLGTAFTRSVPQSAFAWSSELQRIRERIRRQGAVIATAHTGNWDLVACAVAERTPLWVVTKRLSVGALDRVWQWLRARRGVRLLYVGATAQSALHALRRGEAVAMMFDQAPERVAATTTAPFLNALVRVDLSPALLAMRARCPLVVVAPRRLALGSHTVDVLGVLDPPPRPNRAWAENAMQRATTLLDEFVRRHPEQWLWMHRRWKGVSETCS